jgi:hypothetical protein
VEFNKLVHQSGKDGDPIRNEDGTIKLKATWAKDARDHMGRPFNPKVHGEKPALDDNGMLKMMRRDEARRPMTATNKTADFVNKYIEKGYSYRLVNNEGGRIDMFEKHDWEQVADTEGKTATMEVGQARSPRTQAILMRKPQEWYDKDQIEKDKILNANLEDKLKPKEGQYGEGLTQASPLR